MGISSCMLNWCVDQKTDNDLRRLLDVPEYEAVIMMMAVGYSPEQLTVAKSEKTTTSDLVRYL
jgi:nitroreductase